MQFVVNIEYKVADDLDDESRREISKRYFAEVVKLEKLFGLTEVDSFIGWPLEEVTNEETKI